jgi:hypothetical protein
LTTQEGRNTFLRHRSGFFLEMACENTPLQASRLVVEEGNEEFLRFLAVRLIELRRAAAV